MLGNISQTSRAKIYVAYNMSLIIVIYVYVCVLQTPARDAQTGTKKTNNIQQVKKA